MLVFLRAKLVENLLAGRPTPATVRLASPGRSNMGSRHEP
jgi:hypothetical protein